MENLLSRLICLLCYFLTFSILAKQFQQTFFKKMFTKKTRQINFFIFLLRSSTPLHYQIIKKIKN